MLSRKGPKLILPWLPAPKSCRFGVAIDAKARFAESTTSGRGQGDIFGTQPGLQAEAEHV